MRSFPTKSVGKRLKKLQFIHFTPCRHPNKPKTTHFQTPKPLAIDIDKKRERFRLDEEDLSGLTFGPNPLIGNASVIFRHLTQNVTIRVYSVSGQLITEIDERESEGTVVWPTTNDKGERISSGVYSILIIDPVGKEERWIDLAIIR